MSKTLAVKPDEIAHEIGHVAADVAFGGFEGSRATIVCGVDELTCITSVNAESVESYIAGPLTQMAFMLKDKKRDKVTAAYLKQPLGLVNALTASMSHTDGAALAKQVEQDTAKSEMADRYRQVIAGTLILANDATVSRLIELIAEDVGSNLGAVSLNVETLRPFFQTIFDGVADFKGLPESVWGLVGFAESRVGSLNEVLGSDEVAVSDDDLRSLYTFTATPSHLQAVSQPTMAAITPF